MSLEHQEIPHHETPPMALTEVLRQWHLETPRSTAGSENILTREKVGERNLGGGINTTIFVELKDAGAVVFKPKDGERDGLKLLEQFKREEAAYLVDVFLDFGLVPPTVVRDIDGKIGSVQEFVPDAKTAAEVGWWKLQTVGKKEWFKLGLLDYIIHNTDRHAGNYLIKIGKIYAIDHGLAFRNCGYDNRIQFGKEVPEEIIQKFRFFLAWQDGKDALLDLLERRLSKKEAEACLKRIERVGSLLIEHRTIRYDDRKYLTFDGEEKY